MAEEDIEQEEDGEDNPSQELYQDIRKTAEAPRSIDEPENSGRRPLYSTAQEEAVKLTDMQATYRALQPKYPIREINDMGQSLMMARIFPQKYRPMFKMLTVQVMRDNPKLAPRNVAVQVDSAMSIGYDGRCRVEVVEIAGVLQEAEAFNMGNQMMR